MSNENNDLNSNISALNASIVEINDHRFMRIHNSIWSLMWYQFLRGLAFGFGSVAGATILVSIAGYFLNQMEVVPIIGEWAKQLAGEIMNETQQIDSQ